jgi:putative ABC transport system permease protein
MRQALVAGEVTLAMLLLTGSGLLMRTFMLEQQVDLGFRTTHILTTYLELPPARYGTIDSQAAFFRALLPRLEALPGVISAAEAISFPLNGGNPTDFEIPGAAHVEPWKGSYVPCSRQYFATLGLHLLAGRLPTAEDENGKRKIAVINQSMARRLFGRPDPMGQQLTITALKDKSEPVSDPRFEVVGVVSDFKNQGLREPAAPQAFIPYSVANFGYRVIFLHTVGDPALLTHPLSSEILRIDRTIIRQETHTMDEILNIGQFARPRFGLTLFSVFAGIGLVLMTIGVYSVVSWTISEQRHEIGIRMALGANPNDVRRMVLAGTLRFVLFGVAAGILLAWIVGRVLASQLWGVSGYDPVTLSGVIAILIAVGLAAAYVPSLRATRVDPAECLRWE